MEHRSLEFAAPVAPDLIEPVVGYRQWRLHDGALWSPFFELRWGRGVNTARCAVADAAPHDAPAHGCTCGIHAWYRPCPRLASAGGAELVAGAIVVWGEVELHALGMRAEHAMLVALALPLASGGKRRRVREVADALEVPAVPARRLTAAALLCGRPPPRSLVPSSRPPGPAGR